jgi:ABC-2 type transport system ATP-binding protein
LICCRTVYGACTISVNPVIEAQGLSHRYGDRAALTGVSFEVAAGQMFGLLGPNGGGKSTTFKILSTLMPATGGTVRVFGQDIQTAQGAIRRRMGVVFQQPSLDIKLTAAENLTHQGHLYGLRGATLRNRVAELLSHVGMLDRAKDRVETFSGGMRRQVELAKALLHGPELLILDEPSVGLDPGARRDFRERLARLQKEDGVTIVLTTHYMEEADCCDHVAILDEGRVVATGTPGVLTHSIGGDCIQVQTEDAESLCDQIRAKFGGTPTTMDGQVRIECKRGHEFITQLMEAFGDSIRAVTLSKPTLEDVFVDRTGHRFRSSSGGAD